MNVRCRLCPKLCVIPPGQRGDCRVRVNIDGVLRTVVYGFPCAMHVDPMEKKPLFHFLPGSRIFSIATVGCNLHCQNCQNWEISQCNPEDSSAFECAPEKIIELTKHHNCGSIAYTYTDPVIYYEYVLDIARLAKLENIRSVLVTAAYINETPWRTLLEYVDAANIDLKGITEDFYRRVCSASLKPVQRALVVAKTAGIHVEVTNLVIPTLNDKPEDIGKLAVWIKTNMGKDTPLHFSGFTPRYRMQHLPPTPVKTLVQAREIAVAEGLKYVYIGNISVENGQNTYCPSCGQLLVSRYFYVVSENLIENGHCPACGAVIPGVWQ